MMSPSHKNIPSAFPPSHDNAFMTLPRSSGLAITVVLSLLLWAGIVGLFIIF